MVPDDRDGSQKLGSTPWISGWECYGKLWKKITTAWMRFWPKFNPKKRGKHDEQINDENGRRHACSDNAELRCTTRSGVSRAYRSKNSSEVVLGTRRMDHARVHQRGTPG